MNQLSRAINGLFRDSRILWDSSNGTAIRTAKGYRAKPPVQVVKRKLTEAQDNAIGRRIRRRRNKALRSWLPHCKR